MNWKVSPHIDKTFVIWDDDAIVLHPLSGETLHLTGVAKEVFRRLSSGEPFTNKMLERLLPIYDNVDDSQEDLEIKAMSIIKQLVQKELITPCQ